jgi:hypothetical protein
VSGENQIALSVVVTVVGGRDFLRRCLSRLAPQIEGKPIEVFVPYDSTANSIHELNKDFPQVIFLDMGVIKTNARPGTQAATHEIYDCRTAKGLTTARGKVLALLQDCGAPDPDWCDQVLEAHRLPHGVIGGAVEHEGRGVLNWAVYFLDFGLYQLPLFEGPSGNLTDVNVSYKREVLDSVNGLWADRYKEATVNRTLAKKGVVQWLRPQIVVRQDCGKLLFSQVAIERFYWGRLLGSLRAQEVPFLFRLFYITLSPAIPLLLIGRTARKVFAARRNRARFLQSLPQFVAIGLFRCAGEFVGWLTARESSLYA